MEKLNIFVFTWNVASVCYTCNIGEVPKEPNTSSVVFENCDRVAEQPNLDSPNSPDFVVPLIEQAMGNDIVIIGLQEDSIRDSVLLKETIPKALGDDYLLLDLIQLSGWGVTTYKAMKNEWKYLPRGLRLGVFIKKGLKDIISKEISASYVCPSLKDKITWGKGSVVVILKIRGLQNLAVESLRDSSKLAIINMHLPFSASSLYSKELRIPALEYQEKCLKYLIEYVESEYSPDNLIVLGDLNFRVTMWDEELNTPMNLTKLNSQLVANEMIIGNHLDYLIFDELCHLGLYSKFIEGVNNEGPCFVPTCKLVKNRNSQPSNLATPNSPETLCVSSNCGCNSPCFKLGKNLQRFPSWCDRILVNKNGDLKFVGYTRFDYGNMKLSDHAGVIAKLIFNF